MADNVTDEEGTPAPDIILVDNVQAVYDPTLTINPNVQDKMKLYVKVSERKTTNKMTKYERARILGARTEQLRRGDKTYANLDNAQLIEKDPLYHYNIALLELEQKKMPYIILRYRTDGKIEPWSANELIV
jgi:DNA-directed RNA polymerases I, II, and III subunit RPABC2